MFKNICRWGVLGSCAFLVACSTDEKPQIERPMGDIYHKAAAKLREKDFSDAYDEFMEVERQYPYSAWAAKAQLMAAYAAYEDRNFTRAIGTLDNFITLHPYHAQVAYAYYLRALSYYDDIGAVTKDPKVAQSALEALTEVLNRFPETPYARDAKFKRDYVLGHLAGQEMAIGRFYLRQKDYLASFLRFQQVIKRYPDSPQTPEALHRLVESSLGLGLSDEAQQVAAVLGNNYPESAWYADTYLLLKGQDLRPASSKVHEQSWLGSLLP
jgi:outer membrane protein assembly factor BamD